VWVAPLARMVLRYEPHPCLSSLCVYCSPQSQRKREKLLRQNRAGEEVLEQLKGERALSLKRLWHPVCA
jgi:hypothetical protein